MKIHLKSDSVVKVDAGNSVDIVCDSYGETSWYFKRKYFKFEYIPVREKTLILQSITPDAGNYICHGSYSLNIKTDPSRKHI